MTKQHLNICVEPEIKRWFAEHHISPSQFFFSAWNQYIDSDVDTKSKIIIGRISILESEIKRLDDELEKTVGKRYKQLSLMESSPIDMKTKEDVGIEALYNALNDDQKRVLEGKSTFSHLTMTHIENWIDARKEDFGLMLPTRMILQKLKDNGDAHNLCAHKKTEGVSV